jgi:4-alpha-glucanotransferase/alpha-amylase
MTQPVSLLFGVHAHQPVGNFPDVLNDAHLRCYKPFLHVLYRYPDFRFSVHFSGWLLDYLMQHYPEDMALLRDMVARQQVELFGAGDTEPVLAVIPNRDRIGQIEAFSNKLAQKLGQRPQGAWLTERVWESTVIPALVDCGIRYVTVDDYHFLCAGKTATELNGYFTTEEDSHKLDLFPISESLRYKIPFSPVEETIAHLESLADQQSNTSTAAIYFDDIEKFGIWPETYQWVYEKGWLEHFIRSVLASAKIRTRHYSEYHASEKTRGVVYLPTVSYIEMNEWTLPASSASTYADLVQQAKTSGWYEQKKAFLRGGIWKNFFSRYPESNWMHKRMLGLSARLAALPAERRTHEMQQKLYESQANDAYWHGLFGGLYLPHLRRAVYNGLVELEALLDACAPRPAYFIEDIDLDGVAEAFLQNGTLQAVLKLDRFASICELDAYRLKHNFGDTLRCQDEHYYRKIQPGADHSSAQAAGGIASAHDRVSYKLDDNRLQVSYRFTAKLAHGFSTEINLALPSCDGVGGHYSYQGKIPGGFGQLLELTGLTEITLNDDTLGGSIVLKTSSPVTLRAQPHFSVSQSESGFEKIMQAAVLLLEWAVTAPELIITLEFNTRTVHSPAINPA